MLLHEFLQTHARGNRVHHNDSRVVSTDSMRRTLIVGAEYESRAKSSNGHECLVTRLRQQRRHLRGLEMLSWSTRRRRSGLVVADGSLNLDMEPRSRQSSRLSALSDILRPD